MIEKLLTRRQVAEYFAVKPTTVRKWQQRGKIKPFCRVNGRPRYCLEDLKHLLTFKTVSNAK